MILDPQRPQHQTDITEVWGSVLQLLQSIVQNNQAHVIELANRTSVCVAGNDKSITVRNDILTKMSVKSCQLADAIVCLLYNGHADTAFGVWRTMQEIEFNLKILSQDNNDHTAQRFNDWGISKLYRRERLLRDLGAAEMDDADYQSLEETYNENLKFYGSSYKKDSGWYLSGIFDIAKNVGMELEYRKLYSMASSYVHADAISYKSQRNNDKYLVGPNGIGLDLPAALTAVTLNSIVYSFALCTRLEAGNDDERIAVSFEFAVRLFQAIDELDKRYWSPFRQGEKMITPEILSKLPHQIDR